VKMKSLIYK